MARVALIVSHRARWLMTALLALSLLSGCGFKLRGAVEVPDSLKRVYFSAGSETATVRTSKRLLSSNGVKLVSSPQAAPYQLQVLSESSERRAASLTSSAKTKEYELRLSLRFQILDRQGNTVIAPTDLMVERVYTFDEDNVTAKDAEEELLRREMRENLARQLVRRYLGLAAR